MSIAILDIDHFKRLNDTYGHEVGDVVLKAVSRRLKHRVGDRHLLARLGGEEFGIIFHGLGLEKALDHCERLRMELAAQPIDADGEPLTITVSAGLAAISGRESRAITSGHWRRSAWMRACRRPSSAVGVVSFAWSTARARSNWRLS